VTAATGEISRYSRTSNERLARLAWPLLALALLLLLDLLFLKGFFHIEIRDGRLFGTPLDILNRATPVALVSIGMTLVIATGGVDLSVGSVLALAGAVTAVLMSQKHCSMPVSVMIGLLVALAAGIWNGLLVAYLQLQPIVATLVLMVAARGLALMTGEHVAVDNRAFDFIAHGQLLGIRFTFVLVAAVFFLTALLTRRTAAGLFIEAVGGNATASEFAGVNAKLVTVLVYLFSGLCAGIAALVVASDIHESDSQKAGLYLELDAILAVVIGGTALTGGRFSLIGSLLGALIIQTLTTSINSTSVTPQAALVVKALVVLVVCLLQSDALRSRMKALRTRGTKIPSSPVLATPGSPSELS
jgi:simple sugar transport system permease protein